MGSGDQVRGQNHAGLGDLEAALTVTCPPYLSRDLVLISSNVLAHRLGRDSEDKGTKI